MTQQFLSTPALHLDAHLGSLRKPARVSLLDRVSRLRQTRSHNFGVPLGAQSRRDGRLRAHCELISSLPALMYNKEGLLPALGFRLSLVVGALALLLALPWEKHIDTHFHWDRSPVPNTGEQDTAS